MNIGQLSLFIATYERRNYTAAARSIPMSRQGLVKSIASLERDLGVPLFETSGSGDLIPTRYADEFFRYCGRALEEHEQMLRVLGRMRREERTIHLCAATGVIGLLGPGFLESFRQEHPDVEVVQDELPDLLCDEGLKDGRYDMALTVNPFDPEFETVPMYLDDRYAWVASGSPLSELPAIGFSDLAGYHVGVMGQAFKTYALMKDVQRTTGLELASLDSFSEIFWVSQYARSPRHVGVSARHIVNLELFAKEQGIIARPLRDFAWGFGLSWAQERTLEDYEAAFAAHCRTWAERLPRRGKLALPEG